MSGGRKGLSLEALQGAARAGLGAQVADLLGVPGEPVPAPLPVSSDVAERALKPPSPRPPSSAWRGRPADDEWRTTPADVVAEALELLIEAERAAGTLTLRRLDWLECVARCRTRDSAGERIPAAQVRAIEAHLLRLRRVVLSTVPRSPGRKPKIAKMPIRTDAPALTSEGEWLPPRSKYAAPQEREVPTLRGVPVTRDSSPLRPPNSSPDMPGAFPVSGGGTIRSEPLPAPVVRRPKRVRSQRWTPDTCAAGVTGTRCESPGITVRDGRSWCAAHVRTLNVETVTVDASGTCDTGVYIARVSLDFEHDIAVHAATCTPCATVLARIA